MKRPSDIDLVRAYLDEYSALGLADIFQDLFTEEEMKEILLEKMSNATMRGLADEQWETVCDARERLANTHRSPAGGYWL